MAHDILPGKEHAVVTIKIALQTTCPCTIADGLNQLLNAEIGEGFVADYAFYNTDNPLVVTASDDPEEGELFNQKAKSAVEDDVLMYKKYKNYIQETRIGVGKKPPSLPSEKPVLYELYDGERGYAYFGELWERTKGSDNKIKYVIPLRKPES